MSEFDLELYQTKLVNMKSIFLRCTRIIGRVASNSRNNKDTTSTNINSENCSVVVEVVAVGVV